jgi:hypothetical protein
MSTEKSNQTSKQTLEPTGHSQLASLLSSTSLSSGIVSRSGPLIAEVGKEPPVCHPSDSFSEVTSVDNNTKNNNYNPADEGPSLLELMMMEQQTAATQLATEKQQEIQVQSKKSFGGFKKGFFSSPSTSTTTVAGKTTTAVKAAPKQQQAKPDIPVVEVKSRPVQAKSSLVMDDVQTAMQQDNETLNKLRSQGEYVLHGSLTSE